jgi:hypothetical protein
MTLLKFINVFFLQWFFIRLTRHVVPDNKGNYSIVVAWSIQYWIIPITGWWSRYVILNNKPSFFYIYRKNK